MQNRLIILLITLTVSLSCRATLTCPEADQIDLNNPPPGWQVLIPPKDEYQNAPFHFSKALRTTDYYYPDDFEGFPIPYPYYGQVICVYKNCDTGDCPFFNLLSDYTSETSLPSPPWVMPSVLINTWVCEPLNHDPEICEFDPDIAES